MNQLLWTCVNRYRSYTYFDDYLKNSEACTVEVEGNILYSHVTKKLDESEFDELNKNRVEKGMDKLSNSFFALSLYDAKLVGDENENSFCTYLTKRIASEKTSDKKYENVLHLLSYINKVYVKDKSGRGLILSEEPEQGTRVRVKVSRFESQWFPAYGFFELTVLSSAPEQGNVMEAVIANNKEISRLLENNMRMLKKSGLRDEEYDVFFEKKEDKISFPPGYIKKIDYYEKYYHLDTIIKHPEIRANIAYALQMSDVYSFLDNYFFTFASVNMGIKKAEFIHLTTVMEALIIRATGDVGRYCKENCTKCMKERDICPFYFSGKSNTFANRIEKLENGEILKSLQPEEYKFIRECCALRNRIHLAAEKELQAELDNKGEVLNELKSVDFINQLEQTDYLIDCLKKLASDIATYICPGSSQCLEAYTKDYIKEKQQ